MVSTTDEERCQTKHSTMKKQNLAIKILGVFAFQFLIGNFGEPFNQALFKGNDV